MKLRDSKVEFGLVTRLTHLTVLVLIVVQLCLGWGRELFQRGTGAREEVFRLHESFGLILFVVALFFVIWALHNTRPEYDNVKGWQLRLSRWVHWLLFGLIVAEPVLGFLVAQLAGNSIYFFSFARIPPLLGKHRDIGELLAEVHAFVAWCIVMAGGLHGLAALYHHFVERDGILVGMLPWRSQKGRAW